MISYIKKNNPLLIMPLKKHKKFYLFIAGCIFLFTVYMYPIMLEKIELVEAYQANKAATETQVKTALVEGMAATVQDTDELLAESADARNDAE